MKFGGGRWQVCEGLILDLSYMPSTSVDLILCELRHCEYRWSGVHQFISFMRGNPYILCMNVVFLSAQPLVDSRPWKKKTVPWMASECLLYAYSDTVGAKCAIDGFAKGFSPLASSYASAYSVYPICHSVW